MRNTCPGMVVDEYDNIYVAACAESAVRCFLHGVKVQNGQPMPMWPKADLGGVMRILEIHSIGMSAVRLQLLPPAPAVSLLLLLAAHCCLQDSCTPAHATATAPSGYRWSPCSPTPPAAWWASALATAPSAWTLRS